MVRADLREAKQQHPERDEYRDKLRMMEPSEPLIAARFGGIL